MGNTSSNNQPQKYLTSSDSKPPKGKKIYGTLQNACLGCLRCVVPKKQNQEHDSSFQHKKFTEEGTETRRPLSVISLQAVPHSSNALKEGSPNASSPSNQEMPPQFQSTESEEMLEKSTPQQPQETQKQEQIPEASPEAETVESEIVEKKESDQLTLQKLYETSQEAHKREWMRIAMEGLAKAKEINNSSLDGYSEIYHEKKAPHKLTVHFKSYSTSSNTKVNITRSQWYIFCTPEQFMKFVYNSEEQKKIDKGIEVDKIHEKLIDTPDEYCSVNYLGYKKVWITAARDFTYTKHYKKIDEHTWSDCSTSVEIADHPPVEGKVRAGMVLVGHYIQRDDDPVTGQVRYKVSHYSEIDVKINTPDMLAKPFVASTMKKTVEDIDKRLKELYPH